MARYAGENRRKGMIWRVLCGESAGVVKIFAFHMKLERMPSGALSFFLQINVSYPLTHGIVAKWPIKPRMLARNMPVEQNRIDSVSASSIMCWRL